MVKAECQQILRVFHLKVNSIVCIKLPCYWESNPSEVAGCHKVYVSWCLSLLAVRLRCSLNSEYHSWSYGSWITKREMRQKGDLAGQWSQQALFTSLGLRLLFSLSSLLTNLKCFISPAGNDPEGLTSGLTGDTSKHLLKIRKDTLWWTQRPKLTKALCSTKR